MSRPDHAEHNIRGLNNPVSAELLAGFREIVKPVEAITWLSDRHGNSDYEFAQKSTN